MDVDATEHESSMDRELRMQARLKARYPDIPLELALQFSRRLEAGRFTWEAWDATVEWLEATEWFRGRPETRE